uniref:Aldehyde dehydrogenase family protein n=2 Tax=Micromonospora TaxID=1873 RepID=A0A7D6GRZ0_9ACTN|nr:aldehyde dehydrogenase family protein [Micromonospora carbonacea]
MMLHGRRCGDETLEVRSPWDGRVAGRVAEDDAGDVRRAVETVAGYDRGLDVAQRAEILGAAAQTVAARREELADLITAEAGICARDSRTEVDRAAANLRVAAEECRRIRGETIEITAGGTPRLALTMREPVGTVAAVTPFNRPLNQVVVKLAPALAMNNGVVLKPSEKAPLSALALAEILHGSGLPDTMLAVVTGRPGTVGPALVGHPAVDMVTFTGSVATGEAVARAAGMRKLHLELGGNDPLIVLADADLERAARLAAAGACGNAGQSCRGVKRIICADEVADAFVELLVARVERLRCGDPADPCTDVGPLISAEAAATVAGRIDASVRDGAVLRVGGGHRGAVVPPSVLDHVDPGSELVTHETFGPVAPVIRVAGPEAAVAVANSTPYGLQAGVLTRDFPAFLEIASGLRVGAVALDDGPNFDSPYIPFGGVRRSGIGREGIAYSMAEMSTVKTVVLPRAATTRRGS